MSTLFRSLTSTGRAVLLLGVAVMGLGAFVGWTEFAIVGLGCLLAVCIGALWVARPQRIGVTRTLHPSRVTVGESAIGIVGVTNNSRTRIGRQEVEDSLGPTSVRIEIPSLAANETFEQPYTVPASQRGLFSVGPIRASRSDPFGLFRRDQGQGSIEELWIRPRTYRLATISSGFARDLEGQTQDSDPRGSAAFHALREFQFGDDLRHVHWRTTARRNELMVRQYVDTRRSSEVVVLDPRAEFYSDVTYESAVEIAGSVSLASLAERRPCRLILPAQSDLAFEEKLETLDRLALARRIEGVSLSDVFAPVDVATRGASALVIITGNGDPDALIAPARRTMRSGLIVIVNVIEGSEPEAKRVGSARLITVPSADTLGGIWAETVRRA